MDAKTDDRLGGCSFTGGSRGHRNRDWWPEALDIEMLHKNSGLADPMGYVIAVVLIVVSVLAMGASAWVMKGRDYATVQRGGGGLAQRPLGRGQAVAAYAVVGLILFLVLAPHVGLFLLSIATVWSFSPLPDAYTFAHYTRVVFLSQSEDPDLLVLARGAADRLGLAFEHRPTGVSHLAAPILAFAARASGGSGLDPARAGLGASS